METKAAEKRRQDFFASKSFGKQMPVPNKKKENKDAFGQNSEAALIEWEKNQIKPLYREYDKDKKGITRDQLKTIMSRLQKDEAIIGKVPFVAENNYETCFEGWPEKTTWEHFRNNCNSWQWRQVPLEELNEIINEFFAKAYKFKMQGKDAEYKDQTTKALRLQGSITKTKPIEPEVKKESSLPSRTDTFQRTVLRREGFVQPDLVDLDSVAVLDKTAKFKF